MAFKMKKAGVKQIISELDKASKTHKGQADKLRKMVSSPMKGKISGPCKTAAKRKFKVWPALMLQVGAYVVLEQVDQVKWVKVKSNG